LGISGAVGCGGYSSAGLVSSRYRAALLMVLHESSSAIRKAREDDMVLLKTISNR
jgi:trans-aconitate methyltransferase